jgi:hypothetical protein
VLDLIKSSILPIATRTPARCSALLRWRFALTMPRRSTALIFKPWLQRSGNMTTRAQVTFKVRQYVSGQPWIVIEKFLGDLDIEGFLGLELPHGTTFDRAEEIAQYLNENIQAITHTVSNSAERS